MSRRAQIVARVREICAQIRAANDRVTTQRPMTNHIDRIAALSRVDLTTELVFYAAAWIAEHDPQGTHQDDIVQAIAKRLGTDVHEPFDRTYEAAGALVRALAYADFAKAVPQSEVVIGCIRRALQHLDPILAAEVEADGAALVYEQRWEGRAT